MWVERDAMSMQFLARIVSWFVETGTLSYSEGETILARGARLTADPGKPR